MQAYVIDDMAGKDLPVYLVLISQGGLYEKDCDYWLWWFREVYLS